MTAGSNSEDWVAAGQLGNTVFSMSTQRGEKPIERL